MIELHLHLDGSISTETARKLAVIEGVTLPEREEDLQALLMVSQDCKDLNEYLDKFSLPVSLLQSESAIELATYALCEELKAEGCLYAELRFAPQKHGQKGLTQEQVVQAAIRGMERSDFPAQLILCCMREGHDNRAENLETVRLAKAYLGAGVCACDLAGAEALYENERYEEVFAYARRLEIPFTIHAGEARGAQSVEIALQYGAKRIGHGVRSVENLALVKRLAMEQIPLEICPTSNVNTCVYESIGEIPLRTLLEADVVVTVNSDNRSVSHTNLRQELEKVEKAFQLTQEEVLQLHLNAVNGAFLELEEKERLRKVLFSRLQS